MAKDTFYFSHDFNSRHDPKLITIRMEYNMEGIGIFWCLVEMLYEQGGFVRTEYERIAYELRTDCDKVKWIIEQSGLFKIKDDAFYSESVLRRILQREEKSKKAAKSANYRWKKCERTTNALQPDYDGNAIKERKGKERKIKKENDIKEKSADFSIREPEIKIDFRTEGFKKLWKQWTEYKIAEFNDKYKTIQSEQIAFNQFYKMAGGNEKMAGEIITQSISNRWKGLFALKIVDNNNRQPKTFEQNIPIIQS